MYLFLSVSVLLISASSFCHGDEAEQEFVYKRPKLHEHKSPHMKEWSRHSAPSSPSFGIDKIDDFFNEFKSDLDQLNQKKLQKQLLKLVNDVESLLRKSGLVSNTRMNEFIDAGLMNIHKKFNFNRHLDEFLMPQKEEESNFFLHSNTVNDEIIKSQDWNSKKNGPKVKVEEKRSERIINNQPLGRDDNIQTEITDKKQPSYKKPDPFQSTNVKYMKKGYHDVHPKFNDDFMNNNNEMFADEGF